MSPKGRVGAGAVSGVVVPEPLRHSGRMRRKPLGRVNRCRAVLKGHRANRIVSSPSDKQSQGTAASAGECRPGEQGDERRRDAEGSNRLLMFAQHLAALGGGAQRRDQDQPTARIRQIRPPPTTSQSVLCRGCPSLQRAWILTPSPFSQSDP